jgi:hypothetical protein
VIESKGTLPAGMSIDMSKFAQLANTPGMPAMHGTLTEAGTVTIDETSWVEESTGQLDKSANHMTMNITMTFPAGFAGSAGGGSTKLTGTMTMNLAIS